MSEAHQPSLEEMRGDAIAALAHIFDFSRFDEAQAAYIARSLEATVSAAFMRGAWAGRVVDSLAIAELNDRDQKALLASIDENRARREAEKRAEKSGV